MVKFLVILFIIKLYGGDNIFLEKLFHQTFAKADSESIIDYYQKYKFLD